MPSMVSLIGSMLLLAGGIQAHFTVQHPPTAGEFNDDLEGQAPCGGYTPDINKVTFTDFHVDGDTIATKYTHSSGTWLYRITTEPSANGSWVEAYPIFRQTGSGQYCQPHVTVPHNYTGQKGYIGIVVNAPDGKLFQCSAVNFVEGSANQPGDCSNATGVVAEYAPDGNLTALLGNPSNTGSSPPSQDHAEGGAPGKIESTKAVSGMITAGIVVALGAMFVI
ncbi:hypothetical protein M426DRAFT_146649 [Hypoxylon sp. CI-4A]|nr:hypothetical protein M426DRAFT_146649 [Hypoxylon sp. CI-4A]